jgi:hypothetical protein
VKKNLEKFPEHFMFQLTEKETDNMVSQNAIPSKQLNNIFEVPNWHLKHRKRTNKDKYITNKKY